MKEIYLIEKIYEYYTNILNFAQNIMFFKYLKYIIYQQF